MTTKNPAKGNTPGLPVALDDARPVPRDVGGRFNISNRALRNDDLGAFQKIPQRMADAISSLQGDDLRAPLQSSEDRGENKPNGQLAIAICEAKGLPYTDEESAIKAMQAYEFSYIRVDIDTPESEG